MRAALAGKIALCVCPPVLVATSVATVPPVRRTVHRLTAPHHPVVHHRRPHGLAAAPCAPLGGGPGTLRTFASPGPTDEPLTGPGSGTGSPLAFGAPALAGLPGATGDYRSPEGPAVSTPGGLVTPIASGLPTPTPTPIIDTPAVPEPFAWLLMLAGVGAVGATLRGRRAAVRRAAMASVAIAASPAGDVRRGRLVRGAARAGVVAELLASPLGAASNAPTAAATASAGGAAGGGQAVAGGVAAGAKSTKAALLAKAALCVCPPALLATSVATVPPVRHAVYSATAPRALRPALGATPCDPGLAIIDPHAPAVPAGSTIALAGGAIVPVDAAAPATPIASAPAAVPVATASAAPASAPVSAEPTAGTD